jgi:hypothetical protein
MSADVVDAIVERLAEMSVMRNIPDECFAMIRLPVSIPHFCGFARAAERMSPGCVTRQEGQFLLILHPKKKEDA